MRSDKKRGRGWVCIFGGLIVALAAAGAVADEKPARKAKEPQKNVAAEVDRVFDWATPDAPGCACAVSLDGEVIVNRVYGSADLERGAALTTDSLLDAGSIRKQFIAAAILLFVEEGKLALHDDVHKYIPELPDYGHRITIDHLLTHTSGIRDWQPLLNAAGGDPDAMTMILRQRELNFAPGEEWSYSNSGYVLLPEIVERVSEMPFSEFARKRLFEPTGMTATRWVDDPVEVVKNRALAYSREDGDWKMDMYLGNDRGGAGALFTTPRDLVIWNDALAGKRLGAFVTQKLLEPTTLNNGRKLTYARGLQVETRGNEKVVWHSGGAAGYSSFAAHFPDHGLSVAVMCNFDGGAREEYISGVVDLFLPPAAPEPRIEGVEITAKDLNGKAGMYFDVETRQPLRVVVKNTTLGIVPGGPLVALAADRFRNGRVSPFLMSGAEFELRFVSADRFEIKAKEGGVKRYRRAKGYEPSAEDLKAFAGRYTSDELMAVFEFTPAEGGLMGRANGRPGPPFAFQPVDPDTFQFTMFTVRFTRDKAGKVVGLGYSNPMLRHVKFTRVSGIE